jgi:hypothetical protein
MYFHPFALFSFLLQNDGCPLYGVDIETMLEGPWRRYFHPFALLSFLLQNYGGPDYDIETMM